MDKLILPSGRTLSDVVTGVTVNDRVTERTDAVFMAAKLRDLYNLSPVGVIGVTDCLNDVVYKLPIGTKLYTAPVPPKPVKELDDPRCRCEVVNCNCAFGQCRKGLIF